MKKSKKIVMILLIVFLVILLGISGTFAYLYLETDVFKSDKEILIENLSELILGESNFIDSNLKNYSEKKKQSAYENSGNLTLDVQLPEEIVENIDDVNNISVNFSGKANQAERQIEQNIEVDYGKEDLAFSINYKQDKDTYGIQSDYIGAKYTAIENNDSQELEEEFGVNFSETIDKMQITEKLDFSEAESEQIKNTYLTILDEQNTDEKFSSYDISTGKSYQLSLTGEELKNILLKFLEAFKQDTMLQNKFNDILKQEITSSEIDQMIEEVNKLEVGNFKLIIETTDGSLTGIVVQIDNNIISLRKQVTDGQLNYQGEIQTIQDEQNIKIGITSKYDGLQALETINENHNILFQTSAENEIISYGYNFTNTIQFKDSISIEGFNSENSIFLNDYDETSLQNYIGKVVERIGQVNQNHIQKLGVEVNPLIFSNPITMSSYLIYEGASSALEKAQNAQKEMFNDKWKMYEGNQLGTMVNSLIGDVVANNISEVEDKKITVYYENMENIYLSPDATSRPEKLDDFGLYIVTTITNTETGLINGILIVMK